MHRFSLLAGFATAATLLIGSQAAAQTTLTTEQVASGLSSPVDITHAPGDSTRLFVVEQVGRIRIIENGVLLPTPFLDIDPIVQSGGERGLLGLAFHPDYSNNGRFFVNFTNNAGNTRVAEYNVSATDPNIANATQVQAIVTITQDFSNHNGGCIKFGPDDMLYVGMGDGGSGNDPNGRSQNGQQLLGKMLRFDVDLPSPFIPASNPFVGTSTVRDEIYHLGLRNPWRFTFDRDTGDMWIGDVGQGAREEIDFIPAGLAGQNLGWRCLEGFRCTNLSGCSCTDAALLDPIHDYPRNQGISVTGGMIYRGSAIPDLDGTYFFADYGSSRIWSMKYDGTQVTDFTVRTTELDPPTGANISAITSFGEDADGEIYIASQSGRIWKIIPEAPDCGFTNYCTALPTSAGFPAAISASGSASISDNNFIVAAGGLPAGTAGIFFYGPAQVQSPSGIGNLCVAGDAVMPAIRVYPAIAADILGSAVRQIDFTDPNQSMGAGAILPGMTLNFQFWFRDSDMGTATWNFTNGVSVLFCP